MLGLCGQGGSLQLLDADAAIETEVHRTLGVYFSNVPFPNAVGQRSERRVNEPISMLHFIAGRIGEFAFVQGRSERVLLSALPDAPSPLRPVREPVRASLDRAGDDSACASASRWSFLDGSRVVELVKHTAQGSSKPCESILRVRQVRKTRRSIVAAQSSQFTSPLQLYHVLTRLLIPAGPVFAAAHVPVPPAAAAARFVTGGSDGVVRMWGVQVGESGELKLAPLRELQAGGCQVTALAANARMVVAGSLEGTVFAFRADGGRGAAAAPDDGSSAPPDQEVETVVDGQPLIFMLEHTTQPIVGIACSSEQQLTVAADATGAVRLYRPQPDERRGQLRQLRTPAERAAALRWRTIAEMQLGSAAAGCEFGAASQGERLAACSAEGLVRIWPTAALPLEPPPPPPAAAAAPALRDAGGACLAHSEGDDGGGGGSFAGATQQRRAAPPPALRGRRRSSSSSSGHRVTFADEAPADHARQHTEKDHERDGGPAPGVAQQEQSEDTDRHHHNHQQQQQQQHGERGGAAAQRGHAAAAATQVAALQRQQAALQDELRRQQERLQQVMREQQQAWARQEPRSDAELLPPPPRAPPTPAAAPRRPAVTQRTAAAATFRTQQRDRGATDRTTDTAAAEMTAPFVAPSVLAAPVLHSSLGLQAELEELQARPFPARQAAAAWDGTAATGPAAAAHARAATASTHVPAQSALFTGLAPVSLAAAPAQPRRGRRAAPPPAQAAADAARAAALEERGYAGMEQGGGWRRRRCCGGAGWTRGGRGRGGAARGRCRWRRACSGARAAPRRRRGGARGRCGSRTSWRRRARKRGSAAAAARDGGVVQEAFFVVVCVLCQRRLARVPLRPEVNRAKW
ncbi:hypothetical protein JKP88DRAFT_248594 [Tribonema minus]|uniref:Uncharacterized protein n=1 Tax=Tribonema minus TaxID=303371 RepID=A0A836CAG1_9STRA|nr:hypothetical protein JKP88DRAFT_248594 [Tribonema minus]